MFEMTKGRDSFWYPYFQITEKTDMIGQWMKKDLEELQDEILKAEALDEIAIVEEEFNLVFDVAKQYPDLIDTSKFTFEVFMDAYVLSVTRAFGYSLPYLMLCPLADCANHHATDIQYELFNEKLTKKG